MKISGHFQQKNGGDPTLEWILSRVGVVTASDFDSLISPLGKIRTGEGMETFLSRKLAERWIGGNLISFNTFSMEQGTILESEAIPFACVKYDLDIQQVGFVATDDGRVGCSPDGLIGFAGLSATDPTDYKLRGDESGIEIKCPQVETQIKYLLAGELPKEYVAQVQGSMFVTGCANWHFLSYHRKLPPLHLIVERNEEFQESLGEALEAFNEKFDAAMARLVDINGGEPTTGRGIVPFKFPATKQTIGDDLMATA